MTMMRFQWTFFLWLLLCLILFPVAPAWSQIRATGAQPVNQEYYNAIPTAAPLIASNNNAVDLTRYMPPPGNQGSLGSCVGWAVAYAMRTFVEGVKKAPSWPTNTASGQFSPSFLYNEVKGRTEGFCDRKGMRVTDALQFTSTVGAISLSSFPYNEADCVVRPSANLLSAAGAYKINAFSSLGPQGNVPLAKIIESLDAGRPVILVIGVDNNFSNYQGGILAAYNGPTLGYHAIIAVGYDRNNGTLKLFNSWGNWGEGGTVRVSFEAAQRMILEGYVILDVSTNQPPAPSPAPPPIPSPTPQPIPPQPNPPPSPRTLTKEIYQDWFNAIDANDVAAVRKGLEQGLRPDVEIAKETGLLLAIDSGNLQLVNLLLAYKPNLNSYVYRIGNYLRLAASLENNPVAITNALIQNGINPNVLDNKGYSMLCFLSATDEIYPGSRQIYSIIKAAGGKCLVPELKFG